LEAVVSSDDRVNHVLTAPPNVERRMPKPEIATRYPWVNRVKAAMASYSKQDRHLIGVSGGLDSRALLHLLPMLGFDNLVVCHLNHNLRGAESLEDSKFVQRIARRLGLPFHMETLTALPGSGSIETAARQARLLFYAGAAERFSTSSIFLAHHADDQVETFLFNLFRGTGSLDNAAIKPESEVAIGSQILLIRRPLLHVWKDDICKFAKGFHLKFREDSTNVSRQMTRNRLRHDLIPVIEKLMGRPVKQTLLRTIELAVGESEFLRSLVPEIQHQPELDALELRKLPVAIQRRTIHGWLRHQEVKGCGFDEIEAIRSLVEHTQVAKVNLPRGVFCRRRAGRLFLQFPSGDKFGV
jgi:tRNA(Ile)-lysidine synthase